MFVDYNCIFFFKKKKRETEHRELLYASTSHIIRNKLSVLRATCFSIY